MKAITLYQPHATLAALGKKKIETRDWGTKYRGYLAIHSSLSLKWIALANELPFRKYLGDGKPWAPLLGQILAVTVLSDCIRIDEDFPFILSDEERAFGDFSVGRYAWILDEPRILTPAIPARGRQRLWEWTPAGMLILGQRHAIAYPEIKKEKKNVCTDLPLFRARAG